MTAEKKTIFIHILKTGGTSIVCELNNSEWQIKPNFYYRHIFYETKKSNSEDIFDKNNFQKYQNYNLFMFVRNPIERLFSEYYYLKDRPEFMALLSRKPTTFFEYCSLVNTQNGMIKFLLGQRIYSNKKIGVAEFDTVNEAIEKIPIRIGVFERYEESLSYLAEYFGIEWSETIEKKRVTIYKPSKIELTEEQIQLVKGFNKFDYMLYELACEKLNESKFDELDIKITGSKYDYVLKYTERFVLFESSFTDKRFLEWNGLFFKELNEALHKEVKNGKEYVEKWNRCVYHQFIHALKEIVQNYAPDNEFILKEEPLEASVKLSEFIKNSLNLYPNVKIGLQFHQDLLKKYS